MGGIDQRPAGKAVAHEQAGLTPGSSAAAGRRPHWRRLLAGSSPREVLARLVNGDPLGLREVVASRLREACYLMDADRVFLRAVARCARFSARYRGQPALAVWLVERVDESIGDLLVEDLAALRAGAVRDEPAGTAHEELALPLGLDPHGMRRACVAFNHAEIACRRAFFALVIEGRSLDELAQAGGPDVAGASGVSGATDIARRARRALDLCLRATAGEPEGTKS